MYLVYWLDASFFVLYVPNICNVFEGLMQEFDVIMKLDVNRPTILTFSSRCGE